MVGADPTLVAVALLVYVGGLFAIAFWARGRTHSSEDYLVAGRRLGLPLASLTLFATWFGAGTLLVAADEVRAEGVRAAALDPLGAGICLLLAGAFLAAPLWRMRLLTLADFFRVRFGARAETLSAVLLVPGYMGWIAAQFVALASLLELLFGIELRTGIALVAGVGTGYTLIGGMWSVVVTDAVQAVLLVAGLVVMAVAALSALGDGAIAAGAARLLADTPAARLAPVPREGLEPVLSWFALLAAGALGNLPTQDLTQRMFAARSAAVARRACLVAGFAYLSFGAVPVLLGLAAALLAPDDERAILPILAGLLLHPLAALLFVLALVSAVLSTIDSAILAPAGVLAQNLLARVQRGPIARLPRIALDRLAVIAVALASVGVAYSGEDAWSLLESAYEIGLVSLLVPLALGLGWRRGGERSALAAMASGTTLWLGHALFGFEWFGGPWLRDGLGLPLPVGLTSAGLALVVYLALIGRHAAGANLSHADRHVPVYDPPESTIDEVQ